MKIKLNKQFVSILVEDLDLRNNDIVLESIGYSNVNDITIFHTYIENLILLEDDSKEKVNKFIQILRKLTPIIETFNYGVHQAAKYMSLYTASVSKLVYDYSKNNKKALEIYNKSINTAAKMMHQMATKDYIPDKTKKDITDYFETKASDYIEKYVNMQSNIVDQYASKVDLSSVFNKTNQKIGWTFREILKKESYDMLKNGKANLNELYSVLNKLFSVYKMPKESKAKIMSALKNNTQIYFNLLKRYHIALNGVNKGANVANFLKNTEKLLQNYGSIINKSASEAMKKINFAKIRMKEYINEINIQFNNKVTTIQKEVKKAVSNGNYITALRKIISGAFNIAKNEILRIYKIWTLHDESIRSRISKIIEGSRNIALTAVSAITMFGGAIYILYIIFKIIQALFMKIKKVFMSKGKNTKQELNSLNIYKNQIQQIKNKAKKEKQKNKK